MEKKKFFRIIGDSVEVVCEVVERVVRLDDLVAQASLEAGLCTPVLPTGCRMFMTKGVETTFVIEQSPQVRTLTWKDMGDKGSWKLSFPYVLFIVVFSGTAINSDRTRVLYRTAPLSGGGDKLLKTNLCNVHADGHVCTGNMRVNGETLAQKADSFVGNFWISEFNADLKSGNFEPAANKLAQVKDLRTWEEETAKNSLFTLSLQWFEYATLNAILGR